MTLPTGSKASSEFALLDAEAGQHVMQADRLSLCRDLAPRRQRLIGPYPLGELGQHACPIEVALNMQLRILVNITRDGIRLFPVRH